MGVGGRGRLRARAGGSGAPFPGALSGRLFRAPRALRAPGPPPPARPSSLLPVLLPDSCCFALQKALRIHVHLQGTAHPDTPPPRALAPRHRLKSSAPPAGRAVLFFLLGTNRIHLRVHAHLPRHCDQIQTPPLRFVETTAHPPHLLSPQSPPSLCITPLVLLFLLPCRFPFCSFTLSLPSHQAFAPHTPAHQDKHARGSFALPPPRSIPFPTPSLFWPESSALKKDPAAFEEPPPPRPAPPLERRPLFFPPSWRCHLRPSPPPRAPPIAGAAAARGAQAARRVRARAHHCCCAFCRQQRRRRRSRPRPRGKVTSLSHCPAISLYLRTSLFFFFVFTYFPVAPAPSILFRRGGKGWGEPGGPGSSAFRPTTNARRRRSSLSFVFTSVRHYISPICAGSV